MDAFAGIDVGSLSTDCVIIDDREEILSYSITETGANSTEAAEKSFEEALVRAAVERNRIKRIVATGYGRISVPFGVRQRSPQPGMPTIFILRAYSARL